MTPRSRSKNQLTQAEIKQAEEDRKNASDEDVTHFEEDDNPLEHAGDFLDKDGESD